jgi:hypothetical protein
LKELAALTPEIEAICSSAIIFQKTKLFFVKLKSETLKESVMRRRHVRVETTKIDVKVLGVSGVD